jgi:hypothetical protein
MSSTLTLLLSCVIILFQLVELSPSSRVTSLPMSIDSILRTVQPVAAGAVANRDDQQRSSNGTGGTSLHRLHPSSRSILKQPQKSRRAIRRGAWLVICLHNLFSLIAVIQFPLCVSPRVPLWGRAVGPVAPIRCWSRAYDAG